MEETKAKNRNDITKMLSKTMDDLYALQQRITLPDMAEEKCLVARTLLETVEVYEKINL